MPRELTDEQYATLQRALRSIAIGRIEQHHPRPRPMTRESMINAARDACELMGWEFFGVKMPGPWRKLRRVRSPKNRRRFLYRKKPEKAA